MTAETPRGFTPYGPSIVKSEGSASNGVSFPMPSEAVIGAIPSSSALSATVYDVKREAPVLSGAGPNPDAFSCLTCGSDCTSLRYHNSKNAKIDLCRACFLGGRFSSTVHSGDFVKIEAKNRGDKWSDQDTLLLLEGVEMYDEDWARVAEHVGRPKDECLLKFIGLPIDDSYQENGYLGQTRSFISPAENPVLSIAAFLAGVVSPEAAKAAAKAATEQVDKEMSGSVSKAGASALGSAAAKAHLMVEQEKVEAGRLVNAVISLQLAKINEKLKAFESLEAFVERERLALEKDRMALYMDRLKFREMGVAFLDGVREGSTFESVGGAERLERIEDTDMTTPQEVDGQDKVFAQV